MTEQTVWQPVEHGFIFREEGISLAVFDNVLGEPPKLWLSSLNARGVFVLPDNLRLCRRVPAQGAGVPEEIRSVLHAALILYITECRELDDPDGETMARTAQTWLDAQPTSPAPGQQQEDSEND